MRNRLLSTAAVASLFALVAVSRGADDAPVAANAPADAPAIHVAHDGLKKLAWQLAVPTGTFADQTVFETIDLLHGLDIHHLQLTPGQALSPEQRQVTVSTAMPREQVAALLAKLKSVHMDIVSYGPVDLGPDAASARAVFAFAKALKAKDLIATPPADGLDALDKLASEFGVNLAIRNGADSAGYVTPEQVLRAVGSRSARAAGSVGSFDDLGQWRSVGADPLAATKLLQGHIVQVGVSDVDAQGHATNVGGGTVDVLGVLRELKREGFKGVITVECEPGHGAAARRAFVASVNALSDAVTQVAGE